MTCHPLCPVRLGTATAAHALDCPDADPATSTALATYTSWPAVTVRLAGPGPTCTGAGT